MLLPEYKPEDDHFHPRTDDIYWNESACFYFYIPEETIFGITYFFHRPNMKASRSEVIIFDDQFMHLDKILFWECMEYIPFLDEFDMFDFHMESSGLKCTLIEPLKTKRIQFDSGRGCELDFTFTGMTPPYIPWQGGKGGEMGQSVAAFSKTPMWRYQQGGHCKGTLRVEGKTYNIDYPGGWHDHSWGPRPPVIGKWRRACVAFCYHSEDHWFDIFCYSQLPPLEDPCIGIDEPLEAGVYCKDGKMGSLVEGVHRTLERDENYLPKKAEFEVKDEFGRELHAVANIKSHLIFHLYTTMQDTLSLAEYEFDGIKHYGDHEEWREMRQQRRLQRALRAGEIKCVTTPSK